MLSSRTRAFAMALKIVKYSYGYVSPSFGSNINAVTANIINTTPPTIVTIKKTNT